MKKLIDQIEFLDKRLLPKFNFNSIKDYTTQIEAKDLTDDVVNSLNELLPDIKDIFPVKNFNLHKFGNKINNGSQALNLLKTCLKVANVSYDQSTTNAVRLLEDNILLTQYRNKMSDIRTNGQSSMEKFHILKKLPKAQYDQMMEITKFLKVTNANVEHVLTNKYLLCKDWSGRELLLDYHVLNCNLVDVRIGIIWKKEAQGKYHDDQVLGECSVSYMWKMCDLGTVSDTYRRHLFSDNLKCHFLPIPTESPYICPRLRLNLHKLPQKIYDDIDYFEVQVDSAIVKSCAFKRFNKKKFCIPWGATGWIMIGEGQCQNIPGLQDPYFHLFRNLSNDDKGALAEVDGIAILEYPEFDDMNRMYKEDFAAECPRKIPKRTRQSQVIDFRHYLTVLENGNYSLSMELPGIGNSISNIDYEKHDYVKQVSIRVFHDLSQYTDYDLSTNAPTFHKQLQCVVKCYNVHLIFELDRNLVSPTDINIPVTYFVYHLLNFHNKSIQSAFFDIKMLL